MWGGWEVVDYGPEECDVCEMLETYDKEYR
jgi:hypothetical protein